MDSINKNQPEQNHEDLAGVDAVTKIRELVKQSPTCFFCTKLGTHGKAFQTRPMSVQQVDDDGNLWFLSASDSHKNAEITHDGHVQLLFQGSAHSDFMTLSARATVSTDKAKIKELWEPILKTWFTEGIDDPRITAIRCEPREGYYWDTRHNRMVAFAKMAIGAVIGQTLDDSIEGALKPKA